jgi:large subunit ribosomal protein L19
VRRAKLYYLRDRVGKAARVAERRWGITDEVLGGDEEGGALDAEGTSQVEAPQAVPAAAGEGTEDAPDLTEVDASETEAAPETDEPAGEPEGETAEPAEGSDEDKAPTSA